MNWKKALRWTAAILGILVLIVVFGGYVLLKTPWFHNYVLAKIIEEGQTATGGKLNVQNWGLHFKPLTTDLYGIVLHGTEPPSAKPLLQADRLTVGVSLRSLLHRKLQLTELLVQHPVANLLVSSNGNNNIPTPPPNKTKSTTNLWDLAVGHTLLSNGEVNYNDKKSRLDADLYDLKTEIRFDSSATRYAGMLSYRNGRLQYENYPSVAHNLDAQFSATPSGATLSSLLLTVGSSRISLHGEVANYNSPTLNAAYQILIHTQDFAAMSPGITPVGDVRIDGELRYQDIPGQPLLRTASVHGTIGSSDLQAVSPDVHLGLRDLKVQYQLANGNLEVHAIAADLVNGHLAAQLGVQHLDTTPVGKIHASLQHLSLESCKQSIKRAEIRKMPVTGTLDATVDGSWTGSIRNIRALADLALRAAVWNNSATPKSATPVDGTVHLTYDGASNIIALHQTVLRMPSTYVILDGQLSNHSDLKVHAIAGDLHQFAVLASALRPPAQSSHPLALSGSATLDALVQGPMLKPRVSAQMNAQNLQVQGSQWKSAGLALNASPSQCNIQKGSLVSAQQGDLTFTAQVGLKNWSYLPSNPIAAQISAGRMSVAELEHLANLQYPITGNLSADIFFQGSQLHPAGHGSIQVLKASAYDQPIQNLVIQFQGANDTIDTQLNLNLPAGSATASLRYTPKTRAYKVDLHAPGMVLQKLQAVRAKNLPVTGTLTASANGAGTLDENPQLDLVLQIPTLQGPAQRKEQTC
jgi:AsmA family